MEQLENLNWARPPGDNRPVGWWDCKNCNERGNPPLSNRCLRCHRTRPGCEKPSGKTAASKKEGLERFLKTLKSILKILPFAAIFVPALRPFIPVIKVVSGIVSSILEDLK